ncbi:MAG TPA: glycoside hydrolase family 15 protein [Anaeromyxobacter sp.]|nr:glycoside hydrolase family 15 protein [Anaeromyxobacter sp.]
MARIEDYALIGDTQTAALVRRDGSIDWLCVPRFDSDACFAALLGDERHGRWAMSALAPVREVRRRYRQDTVVLETDMTTDEGVLRLVDCMPPREGQPTLVRMAEAVRGSAGIRLELAPRFGYGASRGWVRVEGRSAVILCGPEALRLTSPVELREEPGGVSADLVLHEGERAGFCLDWYPSSGPAPAPSDPGPAIEQAGRWWHGWASTCRQAGPWREPVIRSLLTLKALTYAPTGGVVAAATTSLPERLGGKRNWDYRFCWLRDATFTLYALMVSGFHAEARAWRDWLVRAVAGEPEAMQNVYGPAGERRLTEIEIAWLPGYEDSRPVRIGNAATSQFQLDVLGEVLDCLHQARRSGLGTDPAAWRLEQALIEHLAKVWREPDEGIWEIRGDRRRFTYSRVMAWVGLDRAVRAVRRFGLPGPAERWARIRDEIHAEVCRQGFSERRQSFVQSFGSEELDASLLLLPMVGFLPPGDPRVRGTVLAIEGELLEQGLVRRYRTGSGVDGLPAGEGAFLPCSFWLADCYHLLGRTEEARALFERLLDLRNDVGLLSEEYDTSARRLTGNFPQAFSHVAMVNTARNLAHENGPARHRRGP